SAQQCFDDIADQTTASINSSDLGAGRISASFEPNDLSNHSLHRRHKRIWSLSSLEGRGCKLLRGQRNISFVPDIVFNVRSGLAKVIVENLGFRRLTHRAK